jgi:predicted DNA-binding ribbon-helix-helix protein
MKLKRNRIIRNRKGCGIQTKVGSVRAEKEFWDNCDIVAKLEKTSRNELIARVVTKYCQKILDKQNSV